MSGHNKWSKVKNRKGAVDAKRSKLWTKLIREITVAARTSGADPDGNPRLRKALDDARLGNMPKDTVQRAIVRGSGGHEDANYEELVYEGYGPNGVAVVVDSMTDNRNRTSGEIRAVFTRNSGNMGSSGSVLFGFHKRGVFSLDKKPEEGIVPSEDGIMEIGLDHGVEDIKDEGESFTVTCGPDDFQNLRDAFAKIKLIPSYAEIAMVPDTTVHLSGEDLKKFLKLVDALEDLDDVQKVWTNADMDEAELEALTA